MAYLDEQRSIIETLFRDAGDYHSTLESFASFFEKEIEPGARKVDHQGLFPRNNLAELAERGLFGISFPQEYGGAGLPFTVYVAAIEILANACANTALQVSIQGMICSGIKLFGGEAGKDRFLKEYGLAAGRKLISFALTEPCCGSDAKAIQTTADRSGDSYILNGNKMMISNAGETDFALVFAKGVNGVSAFIIPSDSGGFNILKPIEKLGFRGNRLAAIHLEDCNVPKENLLGEEGRGLEYAKQILNSGRITIAAIAVGIAQAALEKSLRYSRKRKAFGQSISNFQLVQQKLSDMATEISAARLLTYYASSLKDRGKDMALQASKAKLFSSETALRVCDHAIQIHGGYGYTDGYDVHRHWRDARLLTIGEGTSDMLRLLIAHLSMKEI
ncbi:MAG: acyl-CoA dehydrogenase family protein [Candidatus Sulfobium sp.]